VYKLFADFNITYPGPTPTDGGANVLDVALGILFGMLGAISTIIIIYAGIRLILSRGNPDAIGKLRSTLIYAAVGLLVALTATGILNFAAGRLG
jgi:hypothetical protein